MTVEVYTVGAFLLNAKKTAIGNKENMGRSILYLLIVIHGKNRLPKSLLSSKGE